MAIALASACGSSNDAPGLGYNPAFDGGSTGNGCAMPNTGCPCATEGTLTACGEVLSQEGSYTTCSEGTRTCEGGAWSACNGTTIAIKSTESMSGSDGSIHVQTLGGTAMTDAGTCSVCDLSCMGFVDNSTGVDAGPNLLPTDAGGWTLPLELTEAGPCQGLQCSIPSCSAGLTTTITGKVYDPAAINPVYNAIVMIPNAAVAAIPAGVSNSACGGAPLPLAVSPTSFAYSALDGTFSITNVPIGTAVPLVIQLGRWRRVTTINTSTLTCGHSLNVSTNCSGLNNYSGSASCPTRLPRVQSEGNIPLTAIGTGGLDAIECMLYRIGVSSSTYSDENGTGRIHIFDDGGATLASPAANDDLSYLLGFACPNGQCPQGSTSTSGISNANFDSNNTTSWTKSGSAVATTNQWSTTGSYSVSLGSGGLFGTCNYSLANTLTQTGLVAPAGASSFKVDENEYCAGNNNYSKVALTDTTAGGTVTCQDCNWQSTTTCYLPVTPGHHYTAVFTNEDTNNSGYCTQTMFDNVGWAIVPTGVPSLLNNYDLVMLPCDGGGEYNSTNWDQSYDDPGRVNLVNYANNGGRIFTSHWGREWIERTSAAIVNGPFPGVATWVGDTQIGSGNAATA